MFNQDILPRSAPGLKKYSLLPLRMLQLMLVVVLLTLVTGSKCPNENLCGEQQTCCQIPSGEYTCCPFHQGECCEDHLHCCPEGMLCHVTESKCSNTTHSVGWTERLFASHAALPKSFRMIGTSTASKDTTTCPDESSCPAEFSCLQLPKGYGCCPLAQGIVCSDGKHCCPNDHQCSADSTSCVKKREPVRAVICADGISECPLGTTCCESADRTWSCCPVPRAVCCADKLHCCPEDSVCHVNASKCVSSTQQELPMWSKFPARLRADWEDHKSVTTTTKMTPPPKSSTVSKTATSVGFALSKGSDVPCDDTVSCPDGSTCCKDGQGGWGCCPFSQAVCCDDFVHCCPHGKKCNLTAQTCEDPSGSIPWLKKEPSRIRVQKVPETKGSDVPCDDTVSCPDGSTCCKDGQGGWGCCPFSQAVCCDDFVHCCPHGKKCNLTAQTCEDPSGSVPWLKKEPSHPRADQKASSDIKCDSSHSCLESSTCCKDFDSNWRCCPFPQGVCCQDHFHCCPHDSTCNLATLTCNNSSGSVPMGVIENTSSPPVQKKQKTTEDGGHGDVKCDEHTFCPEHTTCCFIQKSQKWGCCPLDKALCCEDGEHCCPEHYTCDKTQATCIKGAVAVPWYTKLPAQTRPAPGLGSPGPRCDKQTSCSVGQSCCRLSRDKWGCCPLPEATCCSDGEHCCPTGYTCDVDSGSCVKTIWLQVETVPLTQIHSLQSDIQCGGEFSCKDEETCCKTSDTTWGCCPSPEAVCCSDMKHCCPAGYTCSDEGMCAKGTDFSWDTWQVFFSKKKRAVVL